MSRHVIVTGASRGIGKAIAQLFIDAGDNVVGASRSGEAPAGCAKSIAVDVSNSGEVNAAFKSAIEEFGPIDVLVANAGITKDGLAMRMSDDQWRDVLSINLDGAFYCARAAIASMIKARSGSVIFISSISPFVGNPGQANYAASKAGVVGLARSLATEVAGRGVTVNVVAPGLIDTDMTADIGAARDAMLAMIPMGKSGQPEDIANAYIWLASDAASFISGTVLSVDGGVVTGT